MSALDFINGPIPATPELLQIGLMDPNVAPYQVAASPASFFFNRTWLVTLLASPAAGPPVPFGYNSLRTVFDIEKTAFSDGMKAKISLYNLNSNSMQRYMKGGSMSLAVGYGGIGAPVVPILTNADIYNIRHERKGADIVTTFETMVGGRSLNSPFNFTFPAKTPTTTIINAVIASAGLILGPQVGVVPAPSNFAVTYSGSCRDVLDTIIRDKLKLKWWVDGFVVVIAPTSTPAIPAAVLVSEATGMIGTPNYSLGVGGNNVISFTSLLNPLLKPGAAVSVVSGFVTALAVVKNAKIEGDTHGNKWSVNCEATPLNPAAVAGLSVMG